MGAAKIRFHRCGALISQYLTVNI